MRRAVWAASLRRTSVLVGALSTAIAMMTSVGIMVGSFRQTVITWMDSQLPADLYLRPAGDPAADRHPTIAVDLTDRIAALPGVANVSRFRAYEIEYQGLPVTLAAADLEVGRHIESFRASCRAVRCHSAQGSRRKRRCHRQRAIQLQAPRQSGRHPYAATGRKDRLRFASSTSSTITATSVATSFSIVQPCCVIFPIPRPQIWPSTSSRAQISKTFAMQIKRAAANNDVLIFSNRDIRREAVRIFDQTFAITYALEAVAVIVAVMGIAGALMSIVIDRRREFGLLRILGATTRADPQADSGRSRA